MGRLAWSHVRFRPARTLALVAGVLVAATAFTVLTAASRTAQVRTLGTVSANFKAAYDILVRPEGARTAVESHTGTVQPDFLSGVYGGISMAQYRQIQRIRGVQVAAPIAMLGYAQFNASLFVPVPKAALAGSGRQLFRISTTYVSDNGASQVTQPPSYLYVTPRPLIVGGNVGTTATDGTGPGCVLHDIAVSPKASPFGTAAQSDTSCWSRVNRYDEPPGPGAGGTEAGYWVDWTVPVLIAAIDPDAEAKLDGLDKAVVSGAYLTENEGDTGPTFPVLASSDSGMDEYARTSVQQLATPPAMPDMNAAWASAQASDPGRTVATERTTAQQAYDLALKGAGPTISVSNRQGTFTGISFTGYWSVGQVTYQPAVAGALVPRQVVNPASVWYTGGAFSVAMDDEDSQYRTVTSHVNVSGQNSPAGSQIPPLIKIAGVFDPARITSFDPLSQVPLGDYQPVAATPANAASRAALHGGDMLPSQNLGGLVSEPVNIVTTMSALPALENSQFFTGTRAADPISVIRVRVAGVTGPDALSRARINAVAQQIEQRTGLDVDIVAGSSPSPVTIDLPADAFGQPPLTLSEKWVKEGVAVAILSEVDKTSAALFTLILVVCVLFVVNAGTAAVRGRRRELGVLAAFGWRRSRLFTAVLGELAGIGLAAGLLAAAIAIPASAALGLDASPVRAVAAIPVAIAVAVTAGLPPAWLAARADPASSVQPPAPSIRRARHPRGLTTLALHNLTRTPARTLAGAASLAAGIAALTALTAITLVFRGQITGSLLGNAIAVQVRGVDYLAAAAIIALGVLAVADTVFLNITERAAELAAIAAFGWPRTALTRLIITEGALTGLAGSLPGAALGLAAAACLAGHLPARLIAIAAIAIAAGITITAAATLLPAALLHRRSDARLLAEE